MGDAVSQFDWALCRIALLVMVCCAGCDQREQQSCRMANEYSVARTTSSPMSLEVLRMNPQQVAVFWSADHSLWYSLLNNDGVPASPATPVQFQSQTTTTSPKTFWTKQQRTNLNVIAMTPVRLSEQLVALALLCHQGENDAEIFALVLDVQKGQVRWIARIGQTGLFARNISLIYQKETLAIGWQDTQTPTQSIAFASVHPQTGEVLKRDHLSASKAVYGPALSQNQTTSLVIWSVVGDDEKSVNLYSAPLHPDLSRGTPHRLRQIELFDPVPDIVPYQNGFALIYRDNRDGDSTEEFYFTRLSKDGEALQPFSRISRADGPQGPKLRLGDRHFFSTAVRSYNNNYLVGFNRFDDKGIKTGGEFQVYADKCDFVRAGVVGFGNTAILVYGENADRGGRILASTITCGKK